MRAVQLLRGSPRRKAVAGFAAAITVVTSFFVVQGLAGADVVTAPPTTLLAVGPTSPDNGFPVWYKDSNNLSVGLCLDDTNAFCNITADDGVDVTKPVSFPDNFPDETFYQLAQSQLALPNGTTAGSTTTSRLRSTPRARRPASRSPSAGSASGSRRRAPATT
jgi:hypothetical protein